MACMKTYLFLFFLAFCTCVYPTDEETGPGFSISANTAFFRKTADIVLPIIVKQLQGFHMNLTGIMNFGLFKFNYSLDSFHMNQMYINHTNTGVDLTEGVLDIKVDNFTFDCVANTSFNTIPLFFYGKGYSLFNLTKLSTHLRAELDLGSNNLPIVKLHESVTNLKNDSLDIKFEGTNDVYLLLDKIRASVTPMIINLIGGTMSNETLRSVEKTINGLLESIPSSLPIFGTDVVTDYGLIIPPYITNGFLPLALNGTSRCVNEENCIEYKGERPKKPKKIDVSEGKGSMQIYLSEYFLNSLSIAVFENSLLNLTIQGSDVRGWTNNSVTLDTDLLGVFIPQMRKKYGPKRDAIIRFNVSAPPLINISPKGISMNANADVEVLVNTSNNVFTKALEVELSTNYNLTAAVAKNYLKGNITDYKFQLKVKFKDIEDITVDGITRLVNTFLKLGIPQVNNHLNDGVPLPPLEPYFDLSKCEMSLLEGYIHLDIEPEPCKKHLEELIERMFDSFKKSFGQRRNVTLTPAVQRQNLKKQIPAWLKISFK